MGGAEGAVEVRMGAPGPWASRRIAFEPTSTYASYPAMEPLNEPISRARDAGQANGGGVGPHHPKQPQQQREQHQSYRNGQNHHSHEVGNGGSKSGNPDQQPLQLEWTAPQKIGAGLSNLGNTCFLNSVLQCLTYTPPLAGYLQSGQHKASCRRPGFCAFCALQEHVVQALASSGKVMSPQKFAKNLRFICRSFRMGRQEDSHEYMRYLLEALHKCCLPPELASNSDSKRSQEKSLVYKIFGGQLRSQVECTACSHRSNTYDPFLDLSLEIVRADSVTKALSRFTAVDVLDGDNKYRCLKCKRNVCAKKKFTIESVPVILTIQFKRFSSANGQGGKIDKKVDFDTILDLKPYVSGEQDSVPRYKLFGVLVHSGWSTHSGHYYSYLRASSDIWHVFDDTRVRQVSEKEVLQQKAYMLFYVREGKWADGSHARVIPAKQELPRHSAAVAKQLQSTINPAVSARHVSSPSANALSNEREGIARADTFTKQFVPEAVAVHLVERPSNGQMEPRSKPTVSQPSLVPVEGALKAPLQTVSAVGLLAAVSVTPIASSSDALVSDNGHSNGPEVRFCPLEGESVPAAQDTDQNTAANTECCMTSKNPALEENWDEYQKKGSNPPVGTAPKLVKFMRSIPHIRRYYQAKGSPVKRVSKTGRGMNGVSEAGHSDLEPSTANGNKDVKRAHAFDEDGRGAKRQQRETDAWSMPSTCMALEEFSKTEPRETGSSNRHLEESGPQLRESEGNENSKTQIEVADDRKVGLTHVPVTGENGVKASNGHGNTPHDHLREPLNEAEPQHAEPTLRVIISAEEVRGDVRKNDLGCSTDKKGTENGVAKWPRGAVNRLYDEKVPRWEDIPESSTKEIDNALQHLATEERDRPKPDIWDVEYDRGRTKKARNKINQEVHGGNLFASSSAVDSRASKPSNPFQELAKRNDKGVKRGNRFGFKAGYSLKTGKNVQS